MGSILMCLTCFVYNTVYEPIHTYFFIGDEYGFVILSVVRSKPREYVQHPEYICPDHYWLEENLGFVTNIHQINVAITRSKYGLIIIGKFM